jgi:hypothetical protein
MNGYTEVAKTQFTVNPEGQVVASSGDDYIIGSEPLAEALAQAKDLVTVLEYAALETP